MEEQIAERASQFFERDQEKPYSVEKLHQTVKATSRPQVSATPTCSLDIPATGFLVSMCLSDKDEKFLICFQ